jgi:hypothetical protein
VAYQDWGSAYKSTVMKYDGVNWVVVGNSGFSTAGIQFTSLAFGPSGQPYVAFEDWGNVSEANVMKFDGTNWVHVGNGNISAGNVSYTSLAFSPSGQPYVAYCDWVNSEKATVMKYDFPTGDNELQESRLTLYPNPVTTILNVNLTKIASKIKVIEVYDIQGKMMSFSQTSRDNVKLNTNDYPIGIYILKVKTENSTYIARFCKNL